MSGERAAAPVRDGYLARWQGTEYEALPGSDGLVRLYASAPADGFEEVRPGRFRRAVPDEEIDDLHYVRTRCTWRGEPFVVIAEHAGWLRVEYSGGRSPVAAAMGLAKVDVGVWQAWVQRSDVLELREEVI